MNLESRIRQAIDGLPEGASVMLPVAWLRAGLESGDGAVGDRSVAEFAGEVKRSPSTIRGWLIQKRIPGAYKLPDGAWRIPRASAEEFKRTGGSAVVPAGDCDIAAWREKRGVA